MIYVIAYDIGNDHRREHVSALLGACGARVQYSVFECEVPSPEELRHLRATLLEVIDVDEDQVRVYPIDGAAERAIDVIGNRTLEERKAFWVL